MKVRLTILTENDKPLEALKAFGDDPEEKIKKAWEFAFLMITLSSGTKDKIEVEKVEIVKEEQDEAD